MKRIAIDMDEVIADANLRIIDWYERDFRRRVTFEELQGKLHGRSATRAPGQNP